jgi:Uma2 family endonuclease
MAMAEANRLIKALPGQNDLPCDDGEPMETSFHVAQIALLIDSLCVGWAERRDFYVAGNMFVYFSEHQVRRNDFRGPDLFVVLDTDPRPRKSWVAWEEGGKLPNVVIEITSETTEPIDRGDKMRIYAGIWRTPAYFILDPELLRIDGYRLDADQPEYVPIAPNQNGDLSVPQLGLGLGLRPTRYRQFEQPMLRWIDASGRPLPIGAELAAAADERAAAALAQVRELEAQLDRIKRDPGQ